MIGPIAIALLHREQFTTEFMEYLPDNRHVYDAFDGYEFDGFANSLKFVAMLRNPVDRAW